ncbi:MAG: sugar phosphate isomerase/epimerase [Propionibacteriaceae bacterium]|nr:sugar phosphate isomerase/epimerase [Propionibacteriaceae bacterium]
MSPERARRDVHPHPPAPRVALSTSAVYPETTSAAFEWAGRLGYDAVEIMVGTDALSTDVDAVQRLRDHHQIPIVSVHAPTLLLLPRVWGTDPWEKLERSAQAALQLGAPTVVVHPPFRWQGSYAKNFLAGIKRLTETTGITFCLENMYPWRAPRGEFKAYLPDWDPTDLDYDHLTLDLSHASTSKQSSLEMAKEWGSRLKHVHLTDGTGSFMDEHLVPGRGDQQADQLLHYLGESGYGGDVILEINTRGAKTRDERERDLYEALVFTRTHLAAAERARTSGGSDT